MAKEWGQGSLILNAEAADGYRDHDSMKICLDLRSPGKTGILSYMQRLLKSLLKIDKKNRYIIITDPKHDKWECDGIEKIVVPSLNPLCWMIWSNTVLPRLLKQKGVDIYHSLKHITAFRMKAKKLVTLHGVHMHYVMPEIFKPQETLYWKLTTYIAAKRYDRIITVASAEKDYLVEKVGYQKNKFRITHLAGDERFRVIDDNEKMQNVKEKLKLPDRFILYVGMIHPQKNLEGIIKGYERAKSDLKKDYKLVIAGNKNCGYFFEIFNLVKQLSIENDVIFLGHVSDDLPYVYNLADLFLFPSHYEGFGIVLIEAMASGLPVITSNVDDICEVVGDAAVTVNSKNISEISKAISDILNSHELKQSLINKSLERSRIFSWDRCARETMKIYEELE
ncbi:MAG: glycosyltransferase family 4 protein [Cyclobacteriaceae bacterium]